MGRLLWILAAAFLLGLGVVIGDRMSVEAMGVVVGVVLGIAAAIPTTLLVALAMQRQARPEPPTEPPQVFIVDGGIPRESHTNPTPTYYAGGRYRQIPPPREVN